MFLSLNADGRDLRDCTLPQDIKKFLVEVHDFSEELPGEDVFPVFHPYVTVRSTSLKLIDFHRYKFKFSD